MDIIAHRGSSARAPENTLAAFRLAWQQGADGIELDVHLSRDQRIMVHHDPDTARCAGVRYPLAETDSAILRRLDVGRWKHAEYAGQTIPLLEEVLDEVPDGRHVLIEIKCGREVIPVLQRTLIPPITNRIAVALISFHWDVMAECRAGFPALPCYPVVAAPQSPGSGGITGFDPELIQRARGYAGLDLDHRGLDAGFAAAAREAGLELLTWTVNDPARFAFLNRLGVSAVTTDCPDQWRAVVDMHGQAGGTVV